MMYLSCMSDFVVQYCIAFDDMSLKIISVIWSKQRIKNLCYLVYVSDSGMTTGVFLPILPEIAFETKWDLR